MFLLYCFQDLLLSYEIDQVWVATDPLGKIDYFCHVLTVVLFQNEFPQIGFPSWHIFTERRYHFHEIPKASYFRINEACLWEKKATEDTVQPQDLVLSRRECLVGMGKPSYTVRSATASQLLFTFRILGSVFLALSFLQPGGIWWSIIKHRKLPEIPFRGAPFPLIGTRQLISIQMCLFAGPVTLTPARHFVFECASHFPDKPRGSAFIPQ